jgi:PAS domain S-box-containing protein
VTPDGIEARWRAVSELSTVITSHRSLASLMQDLAARLPLLLNFGYLSLVLHDERRDAMRLHVMEGGGSWLARRPADEGYFMSVDESISGRVWRTQHPIVIGDLRDETRFSPEIIDILTSVGVRSFCSLPLTTVHRRLGALNLGNVQACAYDPDQLELPLVVACHIAVAIDNALHAEELQAERARLEAIVANVPGVVWEVTGDPTEPTQQTTFVSRHPHALFGYAPEQWRASFWTSILHPGDRDTAARALRATFESAQPGAHKFRVVDATGAIRWAEAFVTPTLDAGRVPRGLRGVTVDITAQRQAELERQHQEQRIHEGRLAERARIARDLHDSFVQDVVGCSLQLEGLARAQLADGPARDELSRVLDRLDRAVDHARVAVAALHASASEHRELALELSQLADELQNAYAVVFSATTLGTPWPVRARLRAPLAALACDALRHAFAQPAAHRIDLTIDHGEDALRITIVDDGHRHGDDGVPPSLHLQAAAIGARLAIRRGDRRILELTVPR